MDRVEAPEPLDGEARRGIEERVIQLYQLDPFNDLMRAGTRCRTVMTDRAGHFDAREGA